MTGGIRRDCPNIAWGIYWAKNVICDKSFPNQPGKINMYDAEKTQFSREVMNILDPEVIYGV